VCRKVTTHSTLRCKSYSFCARKKNADCAEHEAVSSFIGICCTITAYFVQFRETLMPKILTPTHLQFVWAVWCKPSVCGVALRLSFHVGWRWQQSCFCDVASQRKCVLSTVSLDGVTREQFHLCLLVWPAMTNGLFDCPTQRDSQCVATWASRNVCRVLLAMLFVARFLGCLFAWKTMVQVVLRCRVISCF